MTPPEGNEGSEKKMSVVNQKRRADAAHPDGAGDGGGTNGPAVRPVPPVPMIARAAMPRSHGAHGAHGPMLPGLRTRDAGDARDAGAPDLSFVARGGRRVAERPIGLPEGRADGGVPMHAPLPTSAARWRRRPRAETAKAALAGIPAAVTAYRARG